MKAGSKENSVSHHYVWRFVIPWTTFIRLLPAWNSSSDTGGLLFTSEESLTQVYPGLCCRQILYHQSCWSLWSQEDVILNVINILEKWYFIYNFLHSQMCPYYFCIIKISTTAPDRQSCCGAWSLLEELELVEISVVKLWRILIIITYMISI